MICLSLDTTTRDGGVALLRDDRVLEERRGDPTRSQAERLPTALVDLLRAHDLAIRDVDVFAVAAGPGSFTGLRIGIATVQGLAFVARRPAIAVSALDALAHIAALDVVPGTVVAAWIDAQRKDVYAARYRVHDAAPFTPERLTSIADPMVGAPAEVLDAWAGDNAVPLVVVGDGAVRYADEIAERVPRARVAGAPPLAGAIGRLAIVRVQRGEVGHPAAIQPLYVRRPDAEVERERRTATLDRR